MIEVYICKDGEPLAQIEIKNTGLVHVGDLADYTVRFGVDRGSAVGVHSRTMYGFPRKHLNVLALVRQALNTLDEKELSLEPGYDPDAPEASLSSSLARGLSGTVQAIQGRFGRLYRD
jgi:hypothetical protein